MPTLERYGLAGDPSDQPLRLSVWGSYQEYAMWGQLVERFEQLHPDLSVKVEYITDRYEGKIQQLMVASSAPDVMLFQDEPFLGFAATGKFADLSPYLKGDDLTLDLDAFWPTAIQSFLHPTTPDQRETLHGLPIWGGVNLVFYNRQAFADQSVVVGPHYHTEALYRTDDGWLLDDNRWTVAEWRRLCNLMTIDEDQDGRPEQFGFLMPGFDYWLPFHWALGASVLDPSKTRTTLYGPEAEASLALYQDLYFEDRVAPSAADMGTMAAGVGFLTGRIAMYTGHPAQMPFLNGVGVDYDVMHTPRTAEHGRATRITWDCLTMSSDSRRKDDAWKLMVFLVGPEAQHIVAETQRSIPARRDAAETFSTALPHVSAEKFVEATSAYGRLQPITPHWDLMIRELRSMVEEVRSPDPRYRLEPRQALGRFLNTPRIKEVLPPLDEIKAQAYRDEYHATRAGR